MVLTLSKISPSTKEYPSSPLHTGNQQGAFVSLSFFPLHNEMIWKKNLLLGR